MLMNPLLKAYDCSDHDPIQTWKPADPGHVDYYLCLHIGLPDQKGADLFYVNVLSAAAADCLDARELEARKKIIVKNYSWDAVMHAVEDILVQIDEPNWHRAAQKLNQHFEWEFENYTPYAPRA